MDQVLTTLYTSILEGNMAGVSADVQDALDAGFAPDEILYTSMIPAMQEVGRLFEEGEYYVPEMLISANSMQSGMAVLKPHLANSNIQAVGRVAVGTVKGDLHDIGKNLVSLMLEGAGFDVINLGVDVSPEKFVEAVKTNKPDIIGLSALLTTTMSSMEATIAALEAAGVRQQVKVMVGGAPVTEGYARQIGADGYAADAGLAASVALNLLARQPER